VTFAELQERLAAAATVRDWHNAFAEWEAESDPDDAHNARLEARERRERLWRNPGNHTCPICLRPKEPSWDLCLSCDLEEAHLYERRDL
jgi:hypothetical protein